jgi:hypothetical protein
MKHITVIALSVAFLIRLKSKGFFSSTLERQTALSL